MLISSTKVSHILKTLSKPKLRTLSKTKAKDEFIARVSTCNPGNSNLREQVLSWVLGYLQMEFFYKAHVEVVWLFQLIGCLTASSLLGSGSLSQGDKEVQSWHQQTWRLGIGRGPPLISKKSCKFLHLMLGKVKFYFLSCACICPLHFIPSVSDSVLGGFDNIIN